MFVQQVKMGTHPNAKPSTPVNIARFSTAVGQRAQNRVNTERANNVNEFDDKDARGDHLYKAIYTVRNLAHNWRDPLNSHF